MYFWNFQTFIWATRVQAGLKTTIDMKFREKITKRWKVIKAEWCIEKKLFMNLIKYMISLKFAHCRSFTGLLNRVSCFIITTLSDFSCVIKMEADWESWELKGGSQKVERDKEWDPQFSSLNTCSGPGFKLFTSPAIFNSEPSCTAGKKLDGTFLLDPVNIYWDQVKF